MRDVSERIDVDVALGYARRVSDLEALFTDDGDDSSLRSALERFVARALFQGRVWDSTRTSDGVSAYRVVERTATRLRICGEIWEINQSRRLFWLEVERSRPGSGFAWSVRFDARFESERCARSAVTALERPDGVEWTRTVEGGEG